MPLGADVDGLIFHVLRLGLRGLEECSHDGVSVTFRRNVAQVRTPIPPSGTLTIMGFPKAKVHTMLAKKHTILATHRPH